MSYDLKIVAGDLRIENGNLAILTGQDKLKQDLIKIATTDVGANPLQSWYGTLIAANIIGNVLPDEITGSLAQSQLQNAIEILKQLQGLQVASGQKVTPDEQISYIRSVSIQRNQQDLRIIQVVINVLNKAFGTINVSFNTQ